MSKHDDVTDLLTELAKVAGEIHSRNTDRDALIRAARKAGASWAEIGQSLGISKQSAWERYAGTAS